MPIVESKYLRSNVIAHGRYATVYLCMSTEKYVIVAGKQIDKASDQDGAKFLSLRAESELLKDLKHPNIAEYLDTEETDAILTLYTTYMAGGSVRSLTEVYGAIQEKTAKAFTIQLLHGLVFLESHKIVHGNVDSTNILVSNRGECQLSGFSLAKRIPTAATDVSGVYGGDITYAAPEAVTGTFGVKNDVWSLGCVFQELVSKHRPWDGKDSAIVSENLRLGTSPLLDNLTISTEGLHLLCVMLTSDSKKRPLASALVKDSYFSTSP